MLNRAWRIILLIVAGVLLLWPDLFAGARWVALIAVIILLIGEIAYKSCCPEGKMTPVTKKMKKKRR